YIYSYDACDTTFSGEITITKAGTTRLYLMNCEGLAKQALYQEHGAPNPVKFRIASHFSVDVDVSLVGPASYYQTVSPGMNILTVVSGTYNYYYAAHGQLYQGIVTITKNGDTVLVVPYTLSLSAE
ncbi:MAG: hypothetical protein OEZ02_11410, partial [Anaerolineae bacterium]|nr:hypothetical protein [Anaerolineae bacterium]